MHNQPYQPLTEMQAEIDRLKKLLSELATRLDAINQCTQANNDSEAQYLAMKLQEELSGYNLEVLRVNEFAKPEYGIFKLEQE